MQAVLDGNWFICLCVRRKVYLARKEAERAWHEKVIGYMIDFGGGWREEDNEISKWTKCWELLVICKFCYNQTQHQPNITKFPVGFEM